MLFNFTAYSSLLLPAVVTGTLAASWLLLRAQLRGTLTDGLLAILLAVPTLSIAQQMLAYAGWYNSHDGYTTAIFYAPWQLNLLLGPSYYLYFRSLTSQEFRLQPRFWWHLLPGLLQFGLAVGAICYDLLWTLCIRGQHKLYLTGTKGPALVAAENIIQHLSYLQYVLLPTYCWWGLADYRRYARYLNDNFSDSERLRFAGLRQILLVQVLALFLSQLFTLLDWKFGLSDATSWYYYFLRGLLIYWLIAVGLQANSDSATSSLRFDTLPEPTPTPEPTEMRSTPIIEIPPSQESLTAELAPELIIWRENLLTLMDEERPWLKPELTLTEVAKQMHITPGLLSKVINSGCGQNFNDFVNAYRVREAQRLLADPRFAHYSLVGVALESGFNSRSTFNRVFKKVVGRAPSELVRPKS